MWGGGGWVQHCGQRISGPAACCVGQGQILSQYTNIREWNQVYDMVQLSITSTPSKYAGIEKKNDLLCLWDQLGRQPKEKKTGETTYRT